MPICPRRLWLPTLIKNYEEKKLSLLEVGAGFIRKYLANQFKKMGYDIIVLSRGDGDVGWINIEAIVNGLENADLLINLAVNRLIAGIMRKIKRKY